MTLLKSLKRLAHRTLPGPLLCWINLQRYRIRESPPFKCVRFGSLRRTTPIHAGFDFGRGTYIDRYYIDRFLQQNAAAIKGRVLELSENSYTMRLGGSRVTQSDILDVRPNHPGATFIADLSAPNNLPSNAFDCVIILQTLQLIYDVRAAIQNLHRILKPGGCVLATVPGISQLAPEEMEYCGDYWRFTHLSLKRLFEEFFPPQSVTVESHGNVLAAIAFLHGLAAEELTPEELDYRDVYFEVSVVLKAVKALR